MRILIVEDNAHIRSLVKLGLEAESFAVDEEADGIAGSYTARTNEYDAVILDIGLPKRRGTDVCKDIRAAGKHMPIMILSVESEIPTKVDMLSIGADDYLTKPFSFEELVARLRALLRRPHATVSPTMIMKDLVVDSRNQSVTRGNKHIYLTRKEFLLLEFLMRNKGSVVTRGRLIEHVWDLDGNPFSNTIETHMCNLRKKLAGPKRSTLIKNVPGRGYQLVTA